MWIRVGGGQPMWIIIKFYNIIIKFANVDKGEGGKTLIHKMWIKRRFFLTPPLAILLNFCIQLKKGGPFGPEALLI